MNYNSHKSLHLCNLQVRVASWQAIRWAYMLAVKAAVLQIVCPGMLTGINVSDTGSRLSKPFRVALPVSPLHAVCRYGVLLPVTTWMA